MAEKKLGSMKRFGARYGRSLKEKVAEIELGYRGRNKCPYCGKQQVKRLAAGLWHCRACKAKFTGKAYELSKKIILKEQESAEEEKPEPEEDSDDEEVKNV